MRAIKDSCRKLEEQCRESSIVYFNHKITYSRCLGQPQIRGSDKAKIARCFHWFNYEFKLQMKHSRRRLTLICKQLRLNLLAKKRYQYSRSIATILAPCHRTSCRLPSTDANQQSYILDWNHRMNSLAVSVFTHCPKSNRRFQNTLGHPT